MSDDRLEPAQEAVILMDMAGYLTGWNGGAQTLLGYNAQEAVGKHVLFLYADGPDKGAADEIELPLRLEHSHVRVRWRKKSGETLLTGVSFSILRDARGDAVGMVAQPATSPNAIPANDMARLHASIIEGSDQGILITDGDERIVSVNSAFSRITGYLPEDALGQTPDLMRSGAHDADFRAKVRAAMHGAGSWHGEIIGRRKNGELFPQSVSISVVRDDQGKVTHAFSIFSDISELRASEERMRHLVNYDSVTGLPNPSLFNQLIGQALAAARRGNEFGAVLAIKLTGFATIDDTLGHEVGEEVLRQAGQRLRQALRDQDILARVDGDEFVVALFGIQQREHAGLVAQKLRSVLEPLLTVGSNSVRIGTSIGISVFPEDGLDAASLLHSSDVAVKQVEPDTEPGHLFYSPEMNLRAKERWQLEKDLRHALTSGQLRLFYQPKVNLRSGHIAGAEALIRWRHPERGMVSPGMFIPIAEETGMILDIGSWVLEEACRQIRVWIESGVDMPPIAVNLSARQFDSKLPARIQAALDRHAVPPERLKLELTESLLVRGAENVIPIMNELVAMGLDLAMDDFGTGYSSLSYLKRFPISTLKVDRSFVIGVPDNGNDCAIASAIVTMGRQLRMEIVAEGVESVRQMAFLRDLHCDQLQGFLFSPALAVEEYERLIRDDVRLKLD